MQWNQIHPLQKQQALELYRTNKSIETISPLAFQLDIQPATLIRRLQEMDRQDRIETGAKELGIRFPVQSPRQWNDYLVLEGEDAIVISDIESPDADLVWLETALLVAIKNGIKRLIILGDTSAGDQEGLATHLATWRESGEVDYKSGIGMIRKMLEIFLIWFDDIDIISGNHDERIAKSTKGQIDLGTFLDNYGTKVVFSRYRKMYFKTHRGYIAMYHQSNFSDNGIRVGRGMYEQENFERSHPYAVIVTHIHHWACGKSKDNLCEIYSLGCSRDRELTQYVNVTPSSHAQWSQSLIVIRNGYLRNLERTSTDWNCELGEFFDKSSIRREFIG